MRSMKESKDLALKETVKILEYGVGKVGADLPIVLKARLRELIIEKVAKLWDDELNEVLSISNIIRELNSHVYETWMFDYKLAYTINQINALVSGEQPKLFSLN